jgi:hypothetical protein
LTLDNGQTVALSAQVLLGERAALVPLAQAGHRQPAGRLG